MQVLLILASIGFINGMNDEFENCDINYCMDEKSYMAFANSTITDVCYANYWPNQNDSKWSKMIFPQSCFLNQRKRQCKVNSDEIIDCDTYCTYESKPCIKDLYTEINTTKKILTFNWKASSNISVFFIVRLPDNTKVNCTIFPCRNCQTNFISIYIPYCSKISTMSHNYTFNYSLYSSIDVEIFVSNLDGSKFNRMYFWTNLTGHHYNEIQCWDNFYYYYNTIKEYFQFYTNSLHNSCRTNIKYDIVITQGHYPYYKTLNNSNYIIQIPPNINKCHKFNIKIVPDYNNVKSYRFGDLDWYLNIHPKYKIENFRIEKIYQTLTNHDKIIKLKWETNINELKICSSSFYEAVLIKSYNRENRVQVTNSSYTFTESPYLYSCIIKFRILSCNTTQCYNKSNELLYKFDLQSRIINSSLILSLHSIQFSIQLKSLKLLLASCIKSMSIQLSSYNGAIPTILLNEKLNTGQTIIERTVKINQIPTCYIIVLLSVGVHSKQFLYAHIKKFVARYYLYYINKIFKWSGVFSCFLEYQLLIVKQKSYTTIGDVKSNDYIYQVSITNQSVKLFKSICKNFTVILMGLTYSIEIPKLILGQINISVYKDPYFGPILIKEKTTYWNYNNSWCNGDYYKINIVESDNDVIESIITKETHVMLKKLFVNCLYKCIIINTHYKHQFFISHKLCKIFTFGRIYYLFFDVNDKFTKSRLILGKLVYDSLCIARLLIDVQCITVNDNDTCNQLYVINPYKNKKDNDKYTFEVNLDQLIYYAYYDISFVFEYNTSNYTERLKNFDYSFYNAQSQNIYFDVYVKKQKSNIYIKWEISGLLYPTVFYYIVQILDSNKKCLYQMILKCPDKICNWKAYDKIQYQQYTFFDMCFKGYSELEKVVNTNQFSHQINNTNFDIEKSENIAVYVKSLKKLELVYEQELKLIHQKLVETNYSRSRLALWILFGIFLLCTVIILTIVLLARLGILGTQDETQSGNKFSNMFKSKKRNTTNENLSTNPDPETIGNASAVNTKNEPTNENINENENIGDS